LGNKTVTAKKIFPWKEPDKSIKGRIKGGFFMVKIIILEDIG